MSETTLEIPAKNSNKFSGSLCNDLKGADVAQGDGAREEDPERESHAVDGAKGGGGSAFSGRLNVGHSFPHALSLMENLGICFDPHNPLPTLFIDLP
ncbi:unnamed protein product [Leuciscus chuanchicus]